MSTTKQPKRRLKRGTLVYSTNLKKLNAIEAFTRGISIYCRERFHDFTHTDHLTLIS